MNILERAQRICRHHDICESCLLFSEAFDECLFNITAPCAWDIGYIKARLMEEEKEHDMG